MLIVLRSDLMCEAWEEYSSGLLSLIKDFVLSIGRLGYMANTLSHSQNDSGDLRGGVVS